MIYYNNTTKTWNNTTHSFNAKINSLCWDGINFIALGSGTYPIQTSVNGDTWVNRSFSNIASNDVGQCICWNGKIYLAYFTNAGLMWSTDFDTWNRRGFLNGFSPSHIFWNGDKFYLSYNTLGTTARLVSISGDLKDTNYITIASTTTSSIFTSQGCASITIASRST